MVGQTSGLLTVEFEILFVVNQLKELPPNTSIWTVSPSQITTSLDVVKTGNGLISMEIVSFLTHPFVKLPVRI